MRSLVIATGSSSSSIVTQKHPHLHNLHFFPPKLHLNQPTFPALSKPISSSSTNSTSTLLTSPHLYPSNTTNVKNPTSTLTHYAHIASKLVECGRFDDFKMVVETVLANSDDGTGNSCFGELLNYKLLVSGIVKGINERNIKGVVELFGCFDQLGIDVLRIFDGVDMELLKTEFSRLVEMGYLDDAVELMESLAGFKFSIKDLVKPGDMIRVFADRRSPYLSVRYACLLPNSEILFCTIMREFAKKADLPCALRVFEAAKQKLSGHNMYFYRTIIDVCGVCGDCFKSRLIYEDLLTKKVTPNIFVFNSLMNVNAHDLTYTMELYQQMQSLGLEADMTSYNILLKACCLSERVDLAQDIYEEVRCLESTGKLKLDVFTYCTIIKVFADANMWQMAVKIKEDMVSAGVTPNTVTWSALISACASVGRVDQATKLFEEMLLAGCEPNSQCFNTLLHACVESCQYDRAFRLFNTWMSGGSLESPVGDDIDDRNSAIIQSLDNDSRPKILCAATTSYQFARSTSFQPTTATYNILLKACGTDLYRARALIDEMRRFGLSPNQISWSILIDICGGAGNVNGALQILKFMSDSGIRPDVVAYTTAIKVCVESRDLKMAFSLFAEMKRCRVKPNLVTYNTLLRARSRYGSLQQVQQCLYVYQDMRKAGYKSNDYYLKLLIEEWCEGVLQNKNEGQSNTRNRVDRGGLRSLLLERVATHLQKNRSESLAVDVQGLTKVEARIIVLAALRMIKEYNNAGCPVTDDLVVILGFTQVGTECVIKDALMKLLKKELGLEVVQINPTITVDRKNDGQTAPDVVTSSGGTHHINESPNFLDAATRRPAVLQRLLITKKSLNKWLVRRLDSVSNGS